MLLSNRDTKPWIETAFKDKKDGTYSQFVMKRGVQLFCGDVAAKTHKF